MLNELVNLTLGNNPSLAGLDDVVEKEILHHDIMYVLHKESVLQQLVFIGGTSLRLCYNSSRLSEDLDFTAGIHFNPAQLTGLEHRIQQHLEQKYGLNVSVRKPEPTNGDTSTWKITIEKHPGRPDIPSQKMHIDICAIPSFDIQNRPIMDHYQINSPISGLPIPVQSLTEILADKMVAFAYRERRIKPRDIWDIVWLKQQGIEQAPTLVIKKLEARGKLVTDFCGKIKHHSSLVENDQTTKNDFLQEMGRFLPQDVAERTVNQKVFWPYLSDVIKEETQRLEQMLNSEKPSDSIDMKM